MAKVSRIEQLDPYKFQVVLQNATCHVEGNNAVITFNDVQVDDMMIDSIVSQMKDHGYSECDTCEVIDALDRVAVCRLFRERFVQSRTV